MCPILGKHDPATKEFEKSPHRLPYSQIVLYIKYRDGQPFFHLLHLRIPTCPSC